MTSKLKCPFCQTELEQMHDKKMLGCPKCLHIADGALWAKVIQSQKDLEESQQATLQNAQTILEIHKDLEIARQALEDIKEICDNCRWCESNIYILDPHDGRNIAETTNKALGQIEHKVKDNE